jgi:transketolase
MLDYCKNIINLEPIDEKFGVFGWRPTIVDGHNIRELYNILSSIKEETTDKPKVIIADTVKGKGVPRLETDSLCHIKALSTEEIDQLLMEMN